MVELINMVHIGIFSFCLTLSITHWLISKAAEREEKWDINKCRDVEFCGGCKRVIPSYWKFCPKCNYDNLKVGESEQYYLGNGEQGKDGYWGSPCW